MDILEVLNYLADKYQFDEQDMSLLNEITNQLVNDEYDDKYDDKEEGEYDYAEEPYEDD